MQKEPIMFEFLRNLYFFNNPKFRESLVVNYISEPNKHIEEYLDYYCEDSLNDYAVLINGSWGAGKTWFIKKIEDKLKDKGYKRVIYISLNGVSKKDIIDDEIFCALHPILSHRATKFFGKVAAGLVKASTKIDLSNGGEKDTSLSISIPNLDVNSALNDGEKLILIFDDLERCQMPIAQTLGYINYFVEHTNSKAIILGNESEIRKNDKEKKYDDEKEKLVGTTFTFHGDAKNALLSFIGELPRLDVKHKLKEKVDLIIEIYNLSNYKNIRTLKQTIREFVRFHDSDFFKKDDELFDLILKYFLIFSLEYRNSGFYEEILKFKDDKGSDETKNKLTMDGFISKYDLNKFNGYILNKKTWNNIIVDNIVDKDLINKGLDENYFRTKAEKPVWFQLMNYFDMSESEFDDLIKQAILKLEQEFFENWEDVIHTYSMLVYFKEKSIIGDDLSGLKKHALNSFNKTIPIKENIKSLSNIDYREHAAGYSFYANGLKSFSDFLDEVNAEYERKYESYFNDMAVDLLDLMSKDSSLFYHRINLTNSSDNLFYDQPIFNKIDAVEFSNKLCDLSKSDLSTVLPALRKRYQLQIQDPVYPKEKDWINDVVKNIKDEILPNSLRLKKAKIEQKILPIFKQIHDSAYIGN
ncbi:P-loop NTPase fold protein [Acinetobacter sp. PK01]|uniref:P-loop NTPase fold protein n=1 Tax=Acinetobacter sp. PK01 TaxID=2930198 RepID=UPI001FB5FD9A|nr:P-loop NTPase fold protein [Acinetobacter sp. PK01]UOG18738.1 KAP family NTPase [Acinetobacter sp. PK01]